MNQNKHVHFIGICGVAMSAMAIAFQKIGWKVTGSDKGFYPPVSNNLKDAGIAFYPGWHVDKMTADGNPDLVVVGNVAGSKNPEWVCVQENSLDYKSYPEVVKEYLVADNSIVCAGTYGKSTSTTLLSWILQYARKNPNYMFGGISLNNLPPAVMNEGADWSVVEGDEYKTSRWDNKAKFYHYKPTHLLLTSVVWDHADVYPTEESYVDAFIDLVTLVPETGVKILSEKAMETIGEKISTEVLTYGKAGSNDYQYSEVVQTKDGIQFVIKHKENSYEISSPVLGDYNADNITGCFAMAHQIGIDTETIIAATKEFKGLKRRLERRASGDVHVYDDIAHSPSKAWAVLNTLSSLYEGRVIGVYEPNSGNRRPQSLPGYLDMFAAADEIVIPRLTKLKVDPNDPEKPVDGKELAETIAKSHTTVNYIEDDEELVNHLATTTQAGDCIVFLGSHSFRNMIEQTVEKIT
jgi:UDP-N-acetylmuramate: L-alanyl-gamma-D-glutamyl-meso-diaminopimelate ligase